MLNRREVMLRGAALAVGVGGVGTLGYLKAQGGPAVVDAHATHSVPLYSERYKGRTIEVRESASGTEVYVDGTRLHLMKLGENAYLSAMCHYEVLGSPVQAARAAVNELHGANLVDLGGHGAHTA
ncbi:tyrosinase family oxidase copper chaperone [Microbispora siamensis]|nr:tyrosinase family oxidase copper chaperone [Microbispora siamensis]